MCTGQGLRVQEALGEEWAWSSGGRVGMYGTGRWAPQGEGFGAQGERRGAGQGSVCGVGQGSWRGAQLRM